MRITRTVAVAAAAATIAAGAGTVAAAHASSGATPAAAEQNFPWPYPVATLVLHVTHMDAQVQLAGKLYDVRVDHGVIESISSTSITLHEGNAGDVTIPISSATFVRLDARPSSLGALHTGDIAYVSRADGGAARGVRAFDPNLAP
jgi:hypothetical protein